MVTAGFTNAELKFVLLERQHHHANTREELNWCRWQKLNE